MSSTVVSTEAATVSRPRSPLPSLLLRPAVLGLLLIVATIALYYPVYKFPFMNFDDDGYVTENVYVQSGLNLDTIRWSFTTRRCANYHPITWLSHALDCTFFGMNPGGPHVVNMLIHATSVLLLFLVLLRATGFAGRSFLVAALFALHPINVEAVAWIAERKTMLSTLFFILALAAYRWYVSQPRWTRYIFVAGLFGAGLLCKPQIITFPCVLLLWDYWPLWRLSLFKGDTSTSSGPSAFPQRSLSYLIKEKIPLFFICLISAAITMKVQGAARPSYWPYTIGVRLENAIVAYVRYLGKALWPVNLAPLYVHPGKLLPIAQVLAAAMLLLAITAFVWAFRRFRYLPVGWLWFLGMLVPMIGIIQVGRQSMADRYAYNAFIGLFLMICWGVGELAQRNRVPLPALAVAALVVLLSLGVVARRQLNYWGDPLAIWEHAAQVTDGNWVAEDLVAEILASRGQVSEAMPHFYRAYAIVPMEHTANSGIAMYLQRHNQIPEALEHFKIVVKPGSEAERNEKMQAFQYMAKDYDALGDLPNAAHCRERFEALSRQPAQ
jgi:hypothetical protein